MFPPFLAAFIFELFCGAIAVLVIGKSVTLYNGDGLPPSPHFSGFLFVSWALAIGGRLVLLLLAAPA